MLVGHVTKEGNLAGPKVLEHMIDCFLMLDSPSGSRYRTLRGQKNRFGAVSERNVAQPAPPSANVDEVENADADALFVSRPVDLQGGAEQFDDILVWLSGHELRGFMVQAGRLP